MLVKRWDDWYNILYHTKDVHVRIDGWEMLVMTEAFVERLVIAAPQGVVKKLQGILAGAQMEADAVCFSGAEALEVLREQEALLLTTVKLEDMSGEELAVQAGDGVDVLMIVPHDFESEVPANVLTLRNPLSPEALVQAVRTMRHCGARMHALRQKAEKLECMLKERKVIERAKGRLMDALHLTEKEAHYRMQKRSMDTGRRIAEIAQEILDSEEIAC